MKKDQWQQAAAILSGVVEESPDDIEALIMLGDCLFYLDELEERQAIYLKCIEDKSKFEPEHIDILCSLWEGFSEEKEYGKAQEISRVPA